MMRRALSSLRAALYIFRASPGGQILSSAPAMKRIGCFSIHLINAASRALGFGLLRGIDRDFFRHAPARNLIRTKRGNALRGSTRLTLATLRAAKEAVVDETS